MVFEIYSSPLKKWRCKGQKKDFLWDSYNRSYTFWVCNNKEIVLIINQNDVTLRFVSTPFIVKYKAGRKNKKPGVAVNNSGLGVRNSETEFWLHYFVV